MVLVYWACQVSQRTEYYTTAKSLLTGGADAMERLMTAYKEVASWCLVFVPGVWYPILRYLYSWYLIPGMPLVALAYTGVPQVVELAGYTQRVSTMLDVFDDCSAARSHRQTKH